MTPKKQKVFLSIELTFPFLQLKFPSFTSDDTKLNLRKKQKKNRKKIIIMRGELKASEVN